MSLSYSSYNKNSTYTVTDIRENNDSRHNIHVDSRHTKKHSDEDITNTVTVSVTYTVTVDILRVSTTNTLTVLINIT